MIQTENNQSITRKDYACSRVFMMFYLDFRYSMQQMETRLLKLRSKKKILGVQNAILLDLKSETEEV